MILLKCSRWNVLPLLIIGLFLLTGCDNVDHAETYPPADESNNGMEEIDHTPRSINEYVEVSNSLDPIVASINRLPGTIREEDNYLTRGHGDFTGRAHRPSRALRVRGIAEPLGTKIVQVEIARNLPTDIFGDLRRAVGREGRLYLVDDHGNRYQPIGYIHQHRDATTVRLHPTRLIDRVEDVPMLPAAGHENLRLIFRVTEGIRITEFRYGDVVVGYCNIVVE